MSYVATMFSLENCFARTRRKQFAYASSWRSSGVRASSAAVEMPQQRFRLCAVAWGARHERILEIADAPQTLLDVARKGPGKALGILKDILQQSGPQSRMTWLENTKLAAIVGSCPKSMDSFKRSTLHTCCALHHPSCPSGVKHWVQFVEAASGLPG